MKYPDIRKGVDGKYRRWEQRPQGQVLGWKRDDWSEQAYFIPMWVVTGVFDTRPDTFGPKRKRRRAK